MTQKIWALFFILLGIIAGLILPTDSIKTLAILMIIGWYLACLLIGEFANGCSSFWAGFWVFIFFVAPMLAAFFISNYL